MPLNGIKTQEISALAVKNMCPSIRFAIIMLDFKLFKKLSGNKAGGGDDDDDDDNDDDDDDDNNNNNNNKGETESTIVAAQD